MDKNNVIFSLEDYIRGLSNVNVKPTSYIYNDEDYMDMNSIIRESENNGWIMTRESMNDLNWDPDLYSLEARSMMMADANRIKSTIMKAAKEIHKTVVKEHKETLIPRIMRRAKKYNRGASETELRKRVDQAFYIVPESKFCKDLENLIFKNPNKADMREGVTILTMNPRTLAEWNGEGWLKPILISMAKIGIFSGKWINDAFWSLFQGARTEGIHKFGQVMRALNIVPLFSRRGSVYNYKEHMGWKGTMNNRNQWFRFAWRRDGSFVFREAFHNATLNSDYELVVMPRFYLRDASRV